MLSPLHTNGVLAADFEEVIVTVLLFLALFDKSTLIFLNVNNTCTLELCCSIILVQWLLLRTSQRFNTFIFHLNIVYLHNVR